jgi:hypothetical protein
MKKYPGQRVFVTSAYHFVRNNPRPVYLPGHHEGRSGRLVRRSGKKDWDVLLDGDERPVPISRSRLTPEGELNPEGGGVLV